MTTKKNIVIVGSSRAGALAASSARQFNEHARVVIIAQSSPWLRSQQDFRRHLLCHDDECRVKLMNDCEIFSKRFDVQIRHDATNLVLDVDAHCLVLEPIKERLSYDELIFALDAEPKTLDVPGLFGDGVFYLRDHEEVTKLKAFHKSGAQKAVVIGAGVYGIEVAQGLKNLGFCVHLIEKKKRLMSTFSMQSASAMLVKLKEQGILVSLDAMVIEAQQQSDRSYELILSNSEKIKTDMVIITIGNRPKTELLANAGAAIDQGGFLCVDDHMRSTLPHVFACGSGISLPQAVSGERIPQTPFMLKRTAFIAGFNAASCGIAMDAIKPISGTFTTAVGDTIFARVGLSEIKARQFLGDDNILITTVLSSPNATSGQETCVRLILDRVNCSIVGGEVFGQENILRNLDLLAVAVTEGFSCDRLINLDLATSFFDPYELNPLIDAAMRARVSLLENTPFISAETLALWLKNEKDFRIIDVGETPKWFSHIAKKTIHVPLEDLRERMSELEALSSPIVIYSQSDHRSYLAQQALIQRGINDVYHLDGGLFMWDLITTEE